MLEEIWNPWKLLNILRKFWEMTWLKLPLMVCDTTGALFLFSIITIRFFMPCPRVLFFLFFSSGSCQEFHYSRYFTTCTSVDENI